MENEDIDVVKETKLLGVMVNDVLSWDTNTSYLVKRAGSRMMLLHKLVDFGIHHGHDDLVNIYVFYVRFILEQSWQVWHSSLSQENLYDLERVQKNALQIILQEEYTSYSNALNKTGLSTLFEICKILPQKCRNEGNVSNEYHKPKWADNYHNISYHDESALSHHLDHW